MSSRFIWILGDQLSHSHPGLRAGTKSKDRVVMIESRKRGGHVKYHRKKLVLVYSAMRHFADELKSAGWEVDYHFLEDTEDFSEAWGRQLGKKKPDAEVVMAEPHNFFERRAVEAMGRKLGFGLAFLPTVQFVVSGEDFKRWASGRKKLRMEDHYRRVREELEILMGKDGEPEGGQWNFDYDNRETFSAWSKDDGAAKPGTVGAEPDDLTREVMADVAKYFPDAPGEVDGFWLPVTRDGAREWLGDFVAKRLGNFGNYQDVMVAGERTLFHSIISPMMNLGLLLPMECVEAAVGAYRAGKAPLAAVEGFTRQIVGWREFINGVYWLRMPEYAELNALGAERELPEFFYTGETDLNCLHETITQVVETGYNHHIQRLMILGNFLLLAGVRPKEALRWFTEMYVDAHEWVMAANVLGMAVHADGGYMASKPYAGAASYISKMSNYCAGCAFDPKKKDGEGACPFNLLYWNFYDQHADRFVKNPRTAMMVRSWQKRDAKTRKKIVGEARAFLESM